MNILMAGFAQGLALSCLHAASYEHVLCCYHRTSVCTSVCMGSSEDNFRELVLTVDCGVKLRLRFHGKLTMSEQPHAAMF